MSSMANFPSGLYYWQGTWWKHEPESAEPWVRSDPPETDQPLFVSAINATADEVGSPQPLAASDLDPAMQQAVAPPAVVPPQPIAVTALGSVPINPDPAPDWHWHEGQWWHQDGQGNWAPDPHGPGPAALSVASELYPWEEAPDGH